MLPRPASVRQSPAVAIGLGIDTSRYGHYAAFLDADLQTAAPDPEVVESAAGYAKLRQRLGDLVARHGRVLDHLGLTARLKGPGPQKRCACPIHRGDGRGRTFGVNLQTDVCQCFDAKCQSQGDVIDLRPCTGGTCGVRRWTWCTSSG